MSLTKNFGLLVVAVLSLFLATPIRAQDGGFDRGCCIPEPETLIAFTDWVDIEKFDCCCAFGLDCSGPYGITGGQAEYGGYTIGYRCGESPEDCSEAQAEYDERHAADPSDMTNFPPIPCGEQGYNTQGWFIPGQIKADGDQICDQCCETQAPWDDCAPQPENLHHQTGWISCICCFE